MATPVPRLQDETYLNWLRDSVALLTLKEGLENFTDRRVSDLHEELHTKVPQPYSKNGPLDPLNSKQQKVSCIQICKTCSHNEVERHHHTWKVRCPSKVCNTWMKHIIQQHIDGPSCNIAKSNLMPQLWPSHPWEVAKCFLPYGCEKVNSARGADVAAILKLLRTCCFMYRFVKDHSLVEKVLAIRHDLMHSNTLTVSDNQLKQHTDQMIEFLKSLEDLSPIETETIQSTIDTIRKLQSKTKDMSPNKEVDALRARMLAVDSELESLRTQCLVYDHTRQDLNRTSDEIKALSKEYQKTKSDIEKLQETKDRFEKFLKENDLDQNMGRMSTVLQQHGERLDQQDVKIQSLEEQMTLKTDTVTNSLSRDDQCEDMEQRIISRLTKMTEEKIQENRNDRDIPKICIVLEIQGGDRAENDHTYTLLHEALNAAQSMAKNPRCCEKEYQTALSFLKELSSKGADVENITLECLVFHLRCNSFKSLLEIIKLVKLEDNFIVKGIQRICRGTVGEKSIFHLRILRSSMADILSYLGTSSDTSSPSYRDSSPLSLPSNKNSVETATTIIPGPYVDKDKDKKEEATGSSSETSSTSYRDSSSMSLPSNNSSVETGTTIIPGPYVDKDKDEKEEATGSSSETSSPAYRDSSSMSLPSNNSSVETGTTIIPGPYVDKDKEEKEEATDTKSAGGTLTDKRGKSDARQAHISRMATLVPRLQDEAYLNWLRDSVALLTLKEGLENFTDRRVSDLHEELHTKVPQPYSKNGPLDPLNSKQKKVSCVQICKTCSHNEVERHHHTWRVKCPSKVCSAWIKHILQYHIDGPNCNIAKSNLKPQLWHSHPWEVAKCFLPYGCEKINSARDADVAAVLKLLRTCCFMYRFMKDHGLVEEILAIRHCLMHSNTLTVSDNQLKQHTDQIIEFLKTLEDLSQTETETIQRTIDTIKELQSKTTDMSPNKELGALRARMLAVDSELESLKTQCLVYDQTRLDQNRTSDEIQALGECYQKTKSDIDKLQETKDRFEKFLKENDLVQNMDRMSTVLQQHDQRLEQQDVKTNYLNQRIDQQDVKIHSLEEQVTLKGDTLRDSLIWKNQCERLQKHLLRRYEQMRFWESPMSSEEVFLSQMYVQPSVKFIREIDDRGMLAEVKLKESEHSELTYERTFLSKTGPCENIYLTGDAGKGKTTFCHQLVLKWCNAVQNIQTDAVSSGELNVLASFMFLFHVSLRDNETIYHIEDMIQEQLLSNAPVSLNISDILKTERCLIVLDGLDEWSCPDNVKKCPDINKHIPGRNTAHTNCVFLTTTRPWKYDVIALKNKDVDKYIELSGIDAGSSEELAQKILDTLNLKSNTSKRTNDFYWVIHSKKLNDFLTVPVLLIQLLTLWHAGKDLGNSQLQLYCSMLDLLFERSKKNLPEEISKCSSTTVATPKQLPECFSTKLYCQKYAKLLHCLAKLAYKALFNKQKEDALVFKSETLEIFGISDSDITLCLHCGILSQCKDYSNYTGKYKKFSFLHKKVQECLTALYLVTNDNVEDNLKEVKQFCNSVETMLEMNQVWLFVAGMDPDMTRRLFECLGNVVSGDELVKTYRQTLYDEDSDSVSLIGRIQDCVSDCVSEGINNGHHYENLCLEDLCIDRDNVRDVERLVFCSDMSKVKSVYIRTGLIDAAKVAAITGQFLQCRSLQRLYLNDWLPSLIPESTVAALVKNNCDSLTSLNLWTEIKYTDKLVTAICSSISKSLMALGLDDVKLTHEHREQILHSLSQSPAIRQLELRGLHCTDHGRECRARIDWSALTQLKTLTLSSSMYVDNLPSLPHSVEKVYLYYVTLAVTSLREFALGLSKTRRAVNVYLEDVTLTETREECGDLEGFLHSCPGLGSTGCKYTYWSNTWYIEFHTNSDDTDSDDTDSDDTDSDDTDSDDTNSDWPNTWEIEFHTNSQ